MILYESIRRRNTNYSHEQVLWQNFSRTFNVPSRLDTVFTVFIFPYEPEETHSVSGQSEGPYGSEDGALVPDGATEGFDSLSMVR